MKKSILFLLPAAALMLAGCTGGRADTSNTGGQSTSAVPSSGTSTSTPTNPTGSSTSEVDPTNYGTLENPLTVTQALAIASAQCGNDGDHSKQRVYAQGIVVGGTEASYGWTKFDLAESFEDTAAKIYVYSANKDSDGKMGYPNDSVIVEGYIVNYKGTIEFSNTSGQKDYATFAKITRGSSSINYEATNATITGLGASAENGTEVSFTVTPDANYEVDKVEANSRELTADDEGVYKFVVKGDTDVVVTTKESGAPEDQVLAEFTCGEDGEKEHADGTAITDGTGTYEETVSGYTLTISNPVKVYTGARDAQGNGCIKLGTSSKVASFEIVVPAGVDYVVILVGGYKTNNAAISVNGGEDVTIAKHSADGEYEEVTAVPGTEDSKVTLATKDAGKRAMINGVRFMKYAEL